MELRLRPLAEQVIVITGASSGIGLVTAKRAAAAGARVVLAARNERDLAAAVASIRELGGRAICHVTDVADFEQVARLGEAAVAEFGHIDTWVNNAGVSIYGRVTDVPIADMRRQFDVNYWGQVHGMLTAVALLRDRGGALINVASAVADRAIPLQGNYNATKHAIKAFTDTLRMELEEAGIPISVTLVKPGSIDTPLFAKAESLLGVEPQPIPPVYAPEVVARVILEAAERPIRDVIAGGMGKVLSVGEKLSPRLTDKYMERSTFDSQKTDAPLADMPPNNLYAPVEHDGGERGRFRGRVHEWSAYTAAVTHPRRAALIGTVAGAALYLARRALGQWRQHSHESIQAQARAD
ncbi:MAG TPA: SDR family oxidoreductase [Gemmatimonadaceae bacterium]|nr:SDR family oxidoreductase [Gemmatimonadaceae bacterium]